MKNEKIENFSNQFLLSDTDILKIMAKEQGWQNKYRRIMLLGKELPVIDEQLKTVENQVAGCESTVWMHTQWQDERLQIAASADAKIVKGLVAIVIAAFNGKTQKQIQAFSISDYLKSLDLLTHLSPSRGNGINAIVQHIMLVANK